MNLREKVELHKRWWARTNEAPLLGPYVPMRMPCPGLGYDVEPGQVAERALRRAEVEHRLPSDMLVVARVDFSVAFVPAMAGAGFEYDGHTSWSVPVASSVQDLRVQPFRPEHPLFQRYLERLEPLLGNWSWDTYLPSLADYLGPLDVLAALLGPENLALEILMHPEEVKRHALDAARTVADMLDYELDLHRAAGLTEGVTEAFSVWLPGRGIRMSEDFSALVGEPAFREFFMEADAFVYERLDSAFLHTHSAACQCMPAIVETRGLGAVELGNDPNGPDLETRLRAGHLVQAKGLALQMGSWNQPLSDAQIERLVTGLDPRGLIVRLETASLDEALRLNDLVLELASRGPRED